eukprot:g28477.t2
MVLALFAIVVSTIFARGSGLSRAQKLFYGHKLEDDRPLPFLDALQVPPTSNSSFQMLNSTSRQAISASASAPMPANYVRRIRRKAQLSRNAHDYRQQIADLKMLADSASRSGNVYQALQALGGMYDEAIMKYKQFLALCITSKNTQGEALAYNCLGIDCFKMGWNAQRAAVSCTDSTASLEGLGDDPPSIFVSLRSMAYRVNGLPPFQVSFSITFPEGYVGKDKLDTKFQVEAEDSQVQVGVLNQLAKTAKFETNKSYFVKNSLELHTKLEALRVIAQTGQSAKASEMCDFAAPEDEDHPQVPYCGGEVLATPIGRSRDQYEGSRQRPFVTSIARVELSDAGGLERRMRGVDGRMRQYDEAIQYHNKHLELADSTGRLIAHTNLGIVFQAMGLSEHAAIHHQHAIEYANRMGSKDAQCFTVGNLGIASAAQGDLQTSRICLQYHLSSAQRGSKSMAADNKFAQNTLKEVSKNAYHRLGQVNATDGRFDEAADHFAKAMEVAKSANQQKDEEVSLAMLGIARGMLSFDEHCAALVRHAEEAR